MVGWFVERCFLKEQCHETFNSCLVKNSIWAPYELCQFFGFREFVPTILALCNPQFSNVKKLLLDIDNINKSTLFRQIIPLNSVRYLQISLRSPRSHCPVRVLSTTTWKQVFANNSRKRKISKTTFLSVKNWAHKTLRFRGQKSSDPVPSRYIFLRLWKAMLIGQCHEKVLSFLK